MRRWAHAVAGLLAGVVMLGGVRAGAQVGASVAEQYLFAAANAERGQRGLEPLRWDGALYRAADGHAREMAARSSISHQYPGESDLAERGRAAGARFSEIAENVAEAPTAVLIHDAWMKSPGHRANLLDAKVDSVGIRVVRREGQLYAVEDFARGVADVSLTEQERIVGALVQSAGIAVLRAPDEARRGCVAGAGYGGDRQPGFVMRYTTDELSTLPETLRGKMASGGFSQAAVGACGGDGAQSFSAFSLVVMLFR